MNSMTPDEIRKELIASIIEQCIWDIPNDDTQEQMRTLYYICGMVDMAKTICDRMEGGK